MRAFGQQVQVVVGEHGRKGVRIVNHLSFARFVSHAKLVGRSRGLGVGVKTGVVVIHCTNGFVQAGRMDAAHGAGVAVGGVDDPCPLNFRQVSTNGQSAPAVLFDLVGSQDFERVLVITMNHWPDRMKWKLGLHVRKLLKVGGRSGSFPSDGGRLSRCLFWGVRLPE